MTVFVILMLISWGLAVAFEIGVLVWLLTSRPYEATAPWVVPVMWGFIALGWVFYVLALIVT